MADSWASYEKLSKPKIFLIRMLVFLGVIVVLIVPVFPVLYEAFLANIFINIVILFALLIGIIFAFRQVALIYPEISWVNTIRFSDPGIEVQRPPVLLAPMAAMLRDRAGAVSMNTQTMRSIVDSVATRLDERRDLSRYMIGLLVFLGLLGTFYGLLNTVSAVADTIRSLSISDSEVDVFFDNLQTGLQAPLSGMGTAFSSSLFGLAGSLILGFLDLQSSGAQNRFYVELEDWLSTVTDVRSEAFQMQADAPGVTPEVARALNTIAQMAQENNNAQATEALAQLAAGITALAKQVRQDQSAILKHMETSEAQSKQLNAVLKALLQRMER